MEEMKPVMKNEKKYKLGIGKKIVAALLAIGLAIGLGVGLVACNKDPVDQDQNPGIEQPGDPDDGKEDPDDGKEDPENPGGDIEDPTDPDDGKEDPENPGEPTDPDDGKEDPPIEDEKEPFVLDTFDELMQYRQNTLYNNLNENFLDGIIYRCTLSHNYSYEDATNVKWSILESSDTDISKAQVRFNLQMGEGYYYYVGEVTFNEPISVQNFADEGKITQEMIENASSKRIYSANTIADQMEQNQSLAEAIVTELGGTVNDSDQFLYSMDNSSTDPEYSWVRNITVKQITDTGVNEYRITISEENVTIENLLEQLQKNLEAGEYKNGAVEANVVTFAEGMDGSVADIPEDEWPEFEEEEAASTASETYRLYGKMKAKDGSSVNIYLPEDLMNELE